MKDMPTKIYSESGMTQYLTRWIFELDSLIRNPSDSSTKKSNRCIITGLVDYLEWVYTHTHIKTQMLNFRNNLRFMTIFFFKQLQIFNRVLFHDTIISCFKWFTIKQTVSNSSTWCVTKGRSI